MTAVSPVVKPANPEFSAHKRSAIGIIFDHIEAFFCLGAEISCGMCSLCITTSVALMIWSVRSNKRHSNSIFHHKIMHEFHILMIICIISIFIFYLHQNDISAIINLILGDLWHKHLVIIFHSIKERLVAYAKSHVSVF